MGKRVSIVGATGYTGGELLRYLVRHPEVTVARVTSETFSGAPIHDIHKFLKGRLGLVCEKLNVNALAADSDLVFVCLPHGAAARTVASLLKKNTRVIDLSADFRLKDAAVYKRWYGAHPLTPLLKESVFGLPERYRDEIRNAPLVANPGCYATATILAGLPLMAGKLLARGPIIVDAKSGVSGAGKKVESRYLFCEANESIQAYALRGHRHQPEIEQEWSNAAGRDLRGSHPLTLVPHLTPMTRGILATLYAPLAKKISVEDLRDRFVQYYAREPFVTVLGAFESPETKAVSHTNHCQIGVALDSSGRQAIVISALDNLVKGASGQAIQNMNLMLGFDETKGLL